MEKANFFEDAGEGKGKKYKSSKADVVKRMLRSYRDRKRKEKIQKLLDRDDHWAGLN